MVVPARRSAAGPEAPGWGDVRRQMMTAAQDVAASVSAYLAAGGDDSGPAAAMAAVAIGVLRDLARRADFGETVVEVERARAVIEDRAVFPRPRGGLRAVT